MTEAENFDDELFADLYNDDEPQAAPAAGATANTSATAGTTSQAAPISAAGAYGDNANQVDHDGGGDHDDTMNDDYDDDDEVDFNLGNGNSSSNNNNNNGSSSNNNNTTGNSNSNGGYGNANQRAEEPFQASSTQQYTPAAHSGHPLRSGPNSKEDGKMFIGGLNWETTDQSLRDYFSQFGEVVECTVMRDGVTGRSRGFGFLTFKDPKTVNIVMVKEHYLDGKIIDPKRAIPRDEQEKTSKIFVGGVSQETTDQEFREYFAQFGRVFDATLMMDKDTGRPRGFGFVTFESEAGVEACLSANLELHGKPIEVKKAQPRGNLRDDDDANRRGAGGKFRRGFDDQSGGAGNGMGGMGGMGGAAGGMTPQLMAQYWQRMQQYFAMMQQQQMAMNRGMGAGMGPGMGNMGNMGGGMGMNPQMMQMMQMQQMQMMNRSGGGGGNPGMNPQMMQQMMAQQQQGGGLGGPGGPGGPPGAPGGPGGNGQGNFSPLDQQSFERPGGGVGGPGSTGGGSWDGTYEDGSGSQQGSMGGGGNGGGFPRNNRPQQPGGPVDPTRAPPANAPTGPKNAGRPGANYRGGGRGGGASRGFHPYAR